MMIRFEYQDSANDSQWHPVTRMLHHEGVPIHETLKTLTRQFPGCNLRAIDDTGQVIGTRCKHNQ